MDQHETEKIASSVAHTKDSVSALKILNDIAPCDREAVLSKAVEIYNNQAAKDPFSGGHYVIKVVQDGGKRIDELVGVQSTWLGLGADQLLPVFKIEVPTDCKQ
jgi:hypothetical protein